MVAFGACYYKLVSAPSAGPTNSFTALTNTTVTASGTLLIAYRVVAAPASTSTGWTISTTTWAGVLCAVGATNIRLNNFQHVSAATGISVTERTRTWG